MSHPRRFKYIDGREIEADSPVAFFEVLRQTEGHSPGDLGRYLDLLQSRGVLGFGVTLDVGPKDADISERCRCALKSLINHGWVRLN